MKIFRLVAKKMQKYGIDCIKNQLMYQELVLLVEIHTNNLILKNGRK